MMEQGDVTGVILCGGAGRRLARGEKPLARLGGRPLVGHVAARLRPQVSRVIISANASQEAYTEWADHVVEDRSPGQGPLGGIESALLAVSTRYAFVCPGDLPFLPTAIVAPLQAALLREGSELAVAHDGEQRQQLTFLCRTDVASSLTAFLAEGGRKVVEWIQRHRIATVVMAEHSADFLNVNTAADWLRAEQRLGLLHGVI